MKVRCGFLDGQKLFVLPVGHPSNIYTPHIARFDLHNCSLSSIRSLLISESWCQCRCCVTTVEAVNSTHSGLLDIYASTFGAQIGFPRCGTNKGNIFIHPRHQKHRWQFLILVSVSNYASIADWLYMQLLVLVALHWTVIITLYFLAFRSF